jgi:hypothetical protein
MPAGTISVLVAEPGGLLSPAAPWLAYRAGSPGRHLGPVGGDPPAWVQVSGLECEQVAHLTTAD